MSIPVADRGAGERRLPAVTVATAAAAPAPFGHPCAPERGVRFCPAAELTDRVPSFDGTPLDVDVTLPATGDGPFPTLVMEHGYPGTKASFQAPDANGTSGATYHYNDVFYAQQGYAVVTLSARGFGRSCGVPASRTAGCERGWTHIADHRFENRDTQTLLGRLVDEGVARADALAVTGISGGGGRSVGLAFLRDRVRLPNGSLVPWRSPAGTPLRIAAAFPRWGWADLTNALIPNGRLVADAWPSGAQARSPVGVPKENWIDLLYLGGAGSGYLAPPGADPQADLTAWRARIDRGEPFGADVRAIAGHVVDLHRRRRRAAGRQRRAAAARAGLDRRPVRRRRGDAHLRAPTGGLAHRPGRAAARRPRPRARGQLDARRPRLQRPRRGVPRPLPEGRPRDRDHAAGRGPRLRRGLPEGRDRPRAGRALVAGAPARRRVAGRAAAAPSA